MNRLFSVRFPVWVVLILSASLFAEPFFGMVKQNKTQAGFPGEKYLRDWQSVDSLENLGLIQQASDRVTTIYTKAKAAQNTPQIVKSLIHTLKYRNTLQEDAMESFLADLDKETGQADPVLKSILYSIKGELYWQYYQSKMWVINERTPAGVRDEDVKTWDASRFMDESRKYYLLSLENEKELKTVPIEKLEDVLNVNAETRPLRPTVFDFLAHRAIDHFMNSAANLNRPAYVFELDKPAYFGPYTEFIRLKPETPDSTSSDLFTFRLFQRVLSFHSASGNTAALLDADIKRLAFVKDRYKGADKDQLHLDALIALDARFKDKKESGEVKFKIAQTYRELGTAYKPEDADQKTKEYLKKAVDLCTLIIGNYTGAVADNAKALQQEIRKPELQFHVENVVRSNAPALFSLRFSNARKVYFRLLAVNYDEYLKSSELDTDKRTEWLAGKTVLKTWEQELPDDGLFHAHNTELELSALKKGFYVLMAGYDKDNFYKSNSFAFSPFFVSDLALSYRAPYGEGYFETFVRDNETGAPVAGAEVKLYAQRYDYTSRNYKNNLLATLKTDANGQAKYSYSSDRYENLSYTVKRGDDFVADLSRVGIYKNKYVEPARIQTFFFKDRGIYRPGQTVYFKGIKIRIEGEKNALVTNTNTEVVLRDANYQEVSRMKLPVNDFGSFQGSFTIPQGLATGSFSLSDANGSEYFRVEEYKRPKFEVTVNKPVDVFRVNDKVTVKGSAKALAGFNITDAKVAYRVFRRANYPIWCRYWFPIPETPEQEITHGVTKTDNKGEFSLEFTAIPDRNIAESADPTFTYRVEVEVTDDAGETRTAAESVTAGYSTLNVVAAIPDLQNVTDTKAWTIRVENLNGQPQKQSVSVKVERLAKQPLYRSRLWQKPDVFLIPEKDFRSKFPYDVYKTGIEPLLTPAEEIVFEGTYNTADSLGFNNDKRKSWKPGSYRVVMATKDPSGKESKAVSFFTLYDEKDKTSPVNEFFTVKQLNANVEPGSEAQFFLASAKNVKVWYEIEHRNAIIRKEFITLNNEQRFIKIPVIEDYRGGFQVNFSAVIAGRNYTYRFSVDVPYTNKELKIKLESFRDKMLPGSKEEWKLNVSPLLGDKQVAELLLGMYDASLDAFVSNDWFLSIWSSRYGSASWNSSMASLAASQHLNFDDEALPYRFPEYESLNWFGTYFNTYYFRGGRGDALMLESNMAVTAAPSLRGAREKSVDEDQSISQKPGMPKRTEEESKAESTGWTGKNKESADGEQRNQSAGEGEVKARSNFNETAFFFPQIKTDANGNAVFSFTMPESLTRWKFMAFAHTKTLQTGSFTQNVVTQKELMINTFAPRFLREGDEIIFTGKVTNLTEKELSGKATLELKNPISDKSVASDFGLTTAEVSFNVKPGQSAPVEWRLKIPFGAELVKYTVKAVSGNFADGEENVIPVLTNRMLITETVPLWVNGKDSRTFSLPKLNTVSSSRRNHKLTLEFTSNPAWYAIQALPYMMEYPYECAEQTFTRLYANSIATHIANSDPKIKAVFDTWKNYQPEALQSKLEQNSELKNVLLEESPWVRQAINESERKRRIGILFDLNRMRNEQASAEQKLLRLQTSNGGFSWFNGGPDDRYITQHIVAGFGKLRKLGIRPDDAQDVNMVRRAVLYLDERIAHDYDYLIKNKINLEDDNLGYIQIHYLYARSFFKTIPVGDNASVPMAYYVKQTEKYWTKKDDYATGMLAIAMYRADKSPLAKQMIASLKSRSIYNEELGMYWKGMLQGGYYWYNAPIETMALLIEAFDEVTHDDVESVDKMRRWLLKNKQTNDWKTTKATADASYALLLQGTQYLMMEPGVEIAFGKNGEIPFVLPTKTEAGTGYFKQDFAPDQIKPQMADVRVTKKTEGPGWGAMYWQYFEDLDKITKPSTPNPLSVSKKLFKEIKTDRGLKLEEITSASQLEPGDRIISRIIFSSDRPMEYVHLKDMRASGLEPENVLSGYKWKQGLGYYESTRDVATHFFISYVPRGTYVFEYPSRVTHRGNFSNGVTQVQCMYAPEFTFHSEGVRVNIK